MAAVHSASDAARLADARGSLRALRQIFTELSVPDCDRLRGRYRGEPLGPFWVRSTSGPGLALIGLPGWWGKELDGPGIGYNLRQRDTDIERSVSMTLAQSESRLDGQPCASLTYGREAPFALRMLVDELRLVDEARLLGMAVVKAPYLRVGLPFLLTRSDQGCQ